MCTLSKTRKRQTFTAWDSIKTAVLQPETAQSAS
ncbi:hypothetical protein SNOG_08070 [Parastagonospora nodorum SN15]|uniref:Uncharacterized protein n=1 Tax=Phaeosphaeria nodorum (strain SN15 / ATCC MYA-4574 / FGSC 10173) TaxID=321614 RepID=Q0UJJ4_PHANO|nr:hypothetical protein SNOG_08070 [Parastagonospora nodorum SN15]EAT84346.1 hypothetical protein SNOG_08070 [Parastagonospora nodorum SN15]